MKRVGFLYEKIADPENLRLAFWKAQRRKSAKPDVVEYRANLGKNLYELWQRLMAGSLEVGNYHYFTIHDPKERVICAASFPERVLHHAIINVCEPMFERYQIENSYACRKGKGLDAAVTRVQAFCHKYTWYLKLDVHKYFDSIPHNKLLSLLGRHFKDFRLLDLFIKIVESYEVAPGRGIPIGNLTSQYFANLYLGTLDHYVKEELRIGGYVRYMDDFVVFGRSRDELKFLQRSIKTFLKERLDLELNPYQLNRTVAGIPYLGYRVRAEEMRLSLRAKRRFTRKFRLAESNLATGRWSQSEYASHILPLVAFVKRAHCKEFITKVLKKYQGISA